MRGKGEGSVFKDARGLWTAIVELPPRDGKRRRKTIRSKSKKTVVEKLAAMKTELQARGDIVTTSETVAQWFAYWTTYLIVEDLRPNTVSNYTTVANRYIVPTIGHIRMDKVTSDHIERVTRAMRDGGASSTYALNAHQVMKSAFKAAKRLKRVSINPTLDAKPPRKNTIDLEAFTLDEALTVLAHVTRVDDAGRFVDPLGPRWAVALLTGQRRGEVIGLEVDRIGESIDISWQLQRLPTGARGTRGAAGAPVVPADYEYRHLLGGLYLTRPKSSKGRRSIPSFEPLKSILEKHIAETGATGLVFTIDGDPIDPSRDSANWRKVLADVGIDKDVRLHDLRHTAVDLLYLAGVPEDIIQMIVGHSTRAMTRGYKSKALDPRTRQAMAQFGAMFMKPIEGTPPAISG